MDGWMDGLQIGMLEKSFLSSFTDLFFFSLDFFNL
jgi:hypothetical protein